MDSLSLLHCPDCGVAPNTAHKGGCDVERCALCGLQRIGCDCNQEEQDKTDPLPWTGLWPGRVECREFGFWCKWVPGKGWVRCQIDDPGATEDLNRLVMECTWDATQRKWVKPKKS